MGSEKYIILLLTLSFFTSFCALLFINNSLQWIFELFSLFPFILSTFEYEFWLVWVYRGILRAFLTRVIFVSKISAGKLESSVCPNMLLCFDVKCSSYLPSSLCNTSIFPLFYLMYGSYLQHHRWICACCSYPSFVLLWLLFGILKIQLWRSFTWCSYFWWLNDIW